MVGRDINPALKKSYQQAAEEGCQKYNPEMDAHKKNWKRISTIKIYTHLIFLYLSSKLLLFKFFSQLMYSPDKFFWNNVSLGKNFFGSNNILGKNVGITIIVSTKKAKNRQQIV